MLDDFWLVVCTADPVCRDNTDIIDMFQNIILNVFAINKLRSKFVFEHTIESVLKLNCLFNHLSQVSWKNFGWKNSGC